jgi:hypothetical protein
MIGHAALAYAIFGNDGAMDVNDSVRSGILLTLVIVAVLAWWGALVSAIAGAPFARDGRAERKEREGVAWIVALWSVFLSFERAPGSHVRGGLGAYNALSAAALLLVGTYAIDVMGLAPVRRPLVLARRALLVVIALALGAWLLQASPDPLIDLFPEHQQTAQALLAGKSMFEPGVINVLDSHKHTYLIRAYAYPPLSAYLTTISYFFTHDIRWANFAAQLAGGVLIWLVAERCARRWEGERRGLGERKGDRDDSPSLPSGTWADLMAIALIFHPRGLLVLEKAWVEPLAVPFLGGFVLAAVLRRPVVASVCLGLLCAVKQNFVLYLPFLMLTPGVGVTGVLIAGAVAVATFVPELLRSPLNVYRGVVVSIVSTPFRDDALAIPAALSHAGIRIPPWVGFAASAVPFAWLRRVPRELGPLLLGSCLVFGLFYLCGRQAFCNYYYLIDATALFAAATLAAPRGGPAVAASRGHGRG